MGYIVIWVIMLAYVLVQCSENTSSRTSIRNSLSPSLFQSPSLSPSLSLSHSLRLLLRILRARHPIYIRGPFTHILHRECYPYWCAIFAYVQRMSSIWLNLLASKYTATRAALFHCNRDYWLNEHTGFWKMRCRVDNVAGVFKHQRGIDIEK